ncbi:histidine kinase N-terminal 7TM domain-containing protein [Halorubellus sp. PRR65]|uniref:sensor histidine kinase n=1 Tax=Halorubellus sp. PRR65 TaxID=3098148 RepID=UPI002B261EA6|nr:histidine kinase N-terminal 7TM domain-containing protein [Halorubellus sp. PRR65]
MTALTQSVLVVSLVVAVVLLWFGVQQRPRPGATAFAVFAAGTGFWAGGALGGAAADSVAASVAWTRVEYVGITAAPAAFFVLAARYTGNDGLLSRRRLVGVAAASAAACLAMWTTELHWLFYTDIVSDAGTLAGYDAVHGPLYYAWVALGYAFVFGGVVLMVEMLYSGQDIYRNQAAATIVAAVGPIAANLAYQFGLTASDLTPAAFAMSGVALGWALYRFEFMDVTPVARERIVEDSRDGVLVLDDQDRVVDANPAARRLLGVPDDQPLVGRPVTGALDPPFDALPEHFDGVERDARTVTFDTEQGRRFVEVDVRPYADGYGRTRGRLFYLHDVTDRERRERELERQNEQLDRFASVVSHDLRNPLNVAEGYVEVARETGDVSHLGEVETAHERMRAIVDDVLALARYGRTVTDVEPVDVASVAERAWRGVDTGDATIVLNADATVLADESRLRQLLENLFRNSIEHGTAGSHTSAGGGDAVTVTVGGLDDGFYVADDGVGIPASERDAVLEDGYSTGEDGTGLGLSIVTSVADAHGWTVDVGESESGGARFSFTGTTFARRDVGAPLADADRSNAGSGPEGPTVPDR